MANAIPDSTATRDLLEKAASGDRTAFDHLVQRHRNFLLSVLERRLDSRLAARLDASDLLQDTHVKVFAKLPGFLQRRPMPFRLWLW
ncbi:MAG: RNA polymerase sigma factor [Bdellovibrionales bacterium]